MHNKILIIFISLFLLSACTIRPRGILSKSQMIDVLTDLHLADGTLQTKGLVNANNNQLLDNYYGVVLQKHNITQQQFDSSLVWYTDNPKIFNKIYPKVLDNIQKQIDLLPPDELQPIIAEQNTKLQPTKHILPLDSLQIILTQGLTPIYPPKTTKLDSIPFLCILPDSLPSFQHDSCSIQNNSIPLQPLKINIDEPNFNTIRPDNRKLP